MCVCAYIWCAAAPVRAPVLADLQSPPPSAPPSPPPDDADEDQAVDGVLLIMTLMMIVALLQLQRTMLVTLQMHTATATVAAIVIALLTNPGYRKLLGTAWVKGEPYVPVVEEMMESNPQQFYRHFRMYPDTYRWFEQRLWELIRASLPPRKLGPRASTFRKRLLMTIWFLAKGCSYIDLGDRWGLPEVDWRDLLIDEIAEMRRYFICWPTGADFDEVTREFASCRSHSSWQEYGLRRIIGCIDGSFVKIFRPAAYTLDTGIAHNCMKKFYAIQILAVCVHNLMFTYAHVGTPGSRADQHILKLTDLWARIHYYIPPGSGAYLLGDNGFKLYTWLLVPFIATQYKVARCVVTATYNKLMQVYIITASLYVPCVQQSSRPVPATSRLSLWHVGVRYGT